STEVHGALERLSRGMSKRVASLLTGRHRLKYLAGTISGTLDVDRCDYLLRDSHMTGVRYGLYDLDWLLRVLRFGRISHDGKRDWVLGIDGRKGLPPIEEFFLGRHFMYQQVYHHKATRAADALIRSILTRATELLRDGSALPVPLALQAEARGDRCTASD